jgi:omega-6 fatty acid desaturase (delta-12 desaturase)
MTIDSDRATWKQVVAKYQNPSMGRAVWQLANTLIPYAALWYLMYLTFNWVWWLTIPLAVVASGFLVRIFIIFHDCGHGSYFRSRRANDIVGFITSMLTFTSYHHWRWEHAVHHGSTGNLDKRGVGDVWTMTVQEYLESSLWRRFAYRLTRNPVVLFVLAPLFVFVIAERVPSPDASPGDRRAVWYMNAALLVMVLVLGFLMGWKAYLFLQLLVMAIAGAAGVWLFYVQHQFDGAYWQRGENWDYVDAALQGSSYYKLPRILQWFSGNIGFHHIHHLSTRVPNYYLQRCHEANPLFQSVRPTTLLGSFRAATLRLWDEKAQRLIGFRRLAEIRAEARVDTVRRR